MMADDPTSSSAPGAGQQDPADSVGPFNPVAFAIAQALAQVSTIKVVQVMAVDPDAHTVDVQIAVNQLNGADISSPHGTINGVPYAWIMGGKIAFQIDPAVGDLGVMLCADRDISAVKNAQAIANPGSNRKLDAADGIYLFGIPQLNKNAPEFWIKWTTDGDIDIKAAHNNTLKTDANGWHFGGNVDSTGTFGGTDMIANPGALQVTLTQHIHPSNGAPPTPGH